MSSSQGSIAWGSRASGRGQRLSRNTRVASSGAGPNVRTDDRSRGAAMSAVRLSAQRYIECLICSVPLTRHFGWCASLDVRGHLARGGLGTSSARKPLEE